MARSRRLLADVAGWPSWQEPVTSMKLLDPGPLRKGSRFRWTTPATAIRYLAPGLDAWPADLRTVAEGAAR